LQKNEEWHLKAKKPPLKTLFELEQRLSTGGEMHIS